LFEWELPRTSAEVSSPNAIAATADGKLYVTDVTNNRVLIYTLSGTLISSWGVPLLPTGIAVAPSGTTYVVAGGGLHAYSATGALLLTIGTGTLVGPREVVFTPDEELLVTDRSAGLLQRFSADGAHLGSLGAGILGEPIDVAVDQDGSLYVSDESSGLNCVWKLSPSGALLERWGGPGADPGQFNGPAGVCIDVLGNVFVGDHNNGRIERFSKAGALLGVWSYASPGGTTLGVPLDVAADQFGQLYVSDPAGGRILVYGQSPVPTARVTWGALKAKFR
jgi:DNA-binding beta-propeller fold protein YncE